MINVSEAEQIILSQAKDFGTETISFEEATGRVLAEPILADRDFPPFNRVTMDGIAICFKAYQETNRIFKIKNIQAAGSGTQEISAFNECIEIMTGAALPESADTIVPYEDIEIKDGNATITAPSIKKGQNIHYKGRDKKQQDVLVAKNYVLDAAALSVAASVGATRLTVKKLPTVVIISTGDELVDVTTIPETNQVRRSNNYAIKTILKQQGLQPDMMHIPDDPLLTEMQLSKCIDQYDIILISGGISMGKYDFVPKALEKLFVDQLFHKVKQRPGKPFWFGKHNNGCLVFAFPGNPVSTFMCLIRYFIPWLNLSLKNEMPENLFAELSIDFTFQFPLQYFLQVKLSLSGKGCLIASPVEGNGSGDFSNLLAANAFMELPAEENNFTKGKAYRIWPFKPIV